MLTAKMKKISDDIAKIVFSHFDQETLISIYCSVEISIEEIVLQILVLCCRYAFLVNAEKHPISYYIKKEGLEFDPARKEHQRTIDYILEKDELRSERLRQSIGESFGSPDISLTKKGNRFPEYSFTEFQYWESKNIHDMKLVKSIVERRISDSHKTSESEFISIAKEYDSAILAMKETFGKNPESTIFSSLQLFTLQQKYSFDFLYEVAAEMEKQNIKDFPNMGRRLATVSGNFKYVSMLPFLYPNLVSDSDCVIQYQFLIHRKKLIPLLINDETSIDSRLMAIDEASVIANAIRLHMHIGGISLPTFIAEETTMDDWASVFEMYDVFRTFVPDKQWTKAKIQAVRKMYDLVSIDYKSLKNPENRP